MARPGRRRTAVDGVSLAGFGVATGLTALAGGRSSANARSAWYLTLHKPPYQPPAWIFAPVWSVLYGLIAVSGWRVYAKPCSPRRTWALRLWATQLGLNGLWTWLFFSRKRPGAALVDCALLLATSEAYARTAWKIDRVAAGLFEPYVAWLAFATLLNEEIVRRNPPAKTAPR